MGLSLFIAKRVAFNRQRTFSRFIIRLATIATAISVAVMILALAFVNGFQSVVSQKVFSFWGHIHVQHFQTIQASIAEEEPIIENDSVRTLLKGIEGIKSVQAFATKSAILRTPETIEGILFKGIDKSYDSTELRPYLQSGRWLSYPDSGFAPEIIISSITAQQLKLRVNDPVVIYFIQPGGERPRTRKVVVAGIYKTGIEEYDKIYALGDLRLVQRLNDWKEEQIGGYELHIDDYKKMDVLNKRIFSTLPINWYSRSIKEIYPNIFDWLRLQDMNKSIILGVMIIIAIINLITCLIILVLERTRMIGVLKSIGTRDGTIQGIFLWQGIWIAVVGIFWGCLLGLGIAWLQQATGWMKFWDESAYYMSVVPVKIIYWQVLAVIAGTFLICLLALLLPTWITRKVDPVKAVQFR